MSAPNGMGADSDVRVDLCHERNCVVQAGWVAHRVVDAHVADLAAGRSPRVAYLEGLCVGVEADCDDSVVDLAEDAAGLGEDSKSIQLPRVVSIDSDGHWSSPELVLVMLW